MDLCCNSNYIAVDPGKWRVSQGTSFIQLVVSGLLHQYFIAFKVSLFLVYTTFGSLLKFCILKTKKMEKTVKGIISVCVAGYSI